VVDVVDVLVEEAGDSILDRLLLPFSDDDDNEEEEELLVGSIALVSSLSRFFRNCSAFSALIFASCSIVLF
jgi:hypothetical protein